MHHCIHHHRYHKFIGRDASRAFATGCHADACLSASLENLSDAELKELDNWVELYEYHDKYVRSDVFS